ncbi:16S rRNA (uracil(1498)-N(3))-methyltransferase [Nitrospirillum sp. BR 11163]|uniref:16S rRNA (uracil(1498)-N(3))-methyltransferase n=1 Tax=Nitrospirillum sp. BR 11163 TaxID=3104323 RepID=UPI002AFF5054|nr:16S rRNA (uracil(1498)-N(3))-methyltransferase [Nitrospirillum sp. BR 11163]MEA1677015.1 16S rRNA (uracil(1498)-N(3))-methyltransferase [Nitrospirillum sp. BR 11163]
MADRPRTRLHLDAPLAAGQTADLSGDQAHYLRGVLRQAPGDRLLVFNEAGGEWLGEISALTKSGGAVTLLEQTRPPVAVPDVWLLFAPLKGGRTEYVVEKATELGVARLCPVLTRRGDVPRVNLDRLRANAMEAAEQCERLSVPVVDPLADLSAVLAGWPTHPLTRDRTLFVAAETGAARPLAAAVTDATALGRKAAFLVGPEGGLHPGELDQLAKTPFVVPVGLGPRILRADTAAFAVLALWQALAGDWTAAPGQDARPPFR